MVGKSRNMSADMLFMPGLLGLMPPTVCCVRSQSVRDLVTEISGGATPHRCGVAQSSSSELATQAWPSQPHSRLVVPVHVGSRLAYSGSPTHPSLGRLKAVPCIVVVLLLFISGYRAPVAHAVAAFVHGTSRWEYTVAGLGELHLGDVRRRGHWSSATERSLISFRR